MIFERELTGFQLPSVHTAAAVGTRLHSFTLVTPPDAAYPDFKYTIDFPTLQASAASSLGCKDENIVTQAPLAVRTILQGPGYPRPPHTNVILDGLDDDQDNDGVGDGRGGAGLREFTIVARPSETSIVFGFPSTPQQQHSDLVLLSRLRVHLDWTDAVVLSVLHDSMATPEMDDNNDDEGTLVFSDLPGGRSMALTEHGILRHYLLDPAPLTNGDTEAGAGGSVLHFGLGERSAPIDLTGRRFEMHGTDAAHYDAYTSGTLYKHTPFLLCVPKASQESFRSSSGDGDGVLDDQGQEQRQRSSSTTTTTTSAATARSASPPLRRLPYAIYHAANSAGSWDLGHTRDDPWGYFKRYEQDWGGMEQWLIVGEGVKEVVEGWSQVVGKPKLVPRDWLGYAASGMGLGESDSPPAQQLLAGWPDECKKHGIPCSAIHFSSGYTTSPADGKRYVFTLNTDRYPDFKGLIAGLHRRGIKVVPNVKPYVLDTHPDFKHLLRSGALFHDPNRRRPSSFSSTSDSNTTRNAVVTRIWSAAPGTTDVGAWVDLSSEAGATWWAKGVGGLIELGVDGIWNDNNEFYLHDDHFEVESGDKIGLVGRMSLTEAMARVSHDKLVSKQPLRRPFLITRSGNVGTFKYAASTWSGDNETCWRTLRGSQHMQLNASLSLMQSYGSDVGGFCGPLPTPEMFVRWCQLGVTQTRFAIHSFKPDKMRDPNGVRTTNTPWMYPQVLPIIRDAIEWRYEHLPFFNSLMWRSHLFAEPANVWLGFGPFANDPQVYTSRVLEGFNAWLGCEQLLSVPAVFEGDTQREVYLPKSTEQDSSIYFDLNHPFGRHQAGSWITLSTPLEHAGLLAREGAVIPIGKRQHTVTQLKGPGRTTADGVEVEIDEGVVSLDDWRAVKIFPGAQGSYKGSWIEDDGVSAVPAKSVVEVAYEATETKIEIKAQWLEHGFDCAWKERLHVVLPYDERRKLTGEEVSQGEDGAWVVTVQ